MFYLCACGLFTLYLELDLLEHTFREFLLSFEVNNILLFLKSKQQKHQVLDAELSANSDRISTVLNMGKSKF